MPAPRRPKRILLAIWSDVLARALAVMPDLPEIKIVVDPSVRTKPRHYAAVTMGRSPVLLAVHPDLEDQPISRLRGVLAHEMGHVADDHDGFASLGVSRAAVKHDPERAADALAEAITGWKIYYDEELVQRAGPGARGQRPRPPGLR